MSTLVGTLSFGSATSFHLGFGQNWLIFDSSYVGLGCPFL